MNFDAYVAAQTPIGQKPTAWQWDPTLIEAPLWNPVFVLPFWGQNKDVVSGQLGTRNGTTNDVVTDRGSAVNFNGAQDVSSGDRLSFDLPELTTLGGSNGPCSWRAVFRHEGTSSLNNLMACGGPFTNDRRWSLGYDNRSTKRLSFGTYNGEFFSVHYNITLNANQWYVFEVTYSADERVRLYLDGVRLINTGFPASWFPTSTAKIDIGSSRASSGSDNYWGIDGDILYEDIDAVQHTDEEAADFARDIFAAIRPDILRVTPTYTEAPTPVPGPFGPLYGRGGSLQSLTGGTLA